MRNAIAVRLPKELAEWLKRAAAAAGVSQSKVRDQLENARTRENQPFLRFAGKVSVARDLSSRKGFSQK
jgi:hypothetical protein